MSIVARSATLTDRLAAYHAGRSSRHLPPDGTLDRWCEAASDGDPERMLRRLDGLGISPSDLPECLAQPDISRERLPRWCDVLIAAAVPTAAAGTTENPLAPMIDDDPAALPVLLAPLLQAAMNDLARVTPEVAGAAPADAQLLIGGLLRQLQEQLSTLVQTCVAAEIRRSRERLPVGSEVWESWTNAQAAGGLIDLWEAYPALARQVGIAVNNWVDRTEELLTRAAADIDAINDYFGTHVTRLERAVTGLSDPHRGHATVVNCTFVDATGVPTHLIYKPRDISTEVSFAAVCEDLAEHGIDSGAALRMLPRGSYGWVEKVEPRPTVSTEDADIYFRRAGALVALLFALGATDIHGENVVAHGSRPVVIDAETIMQPSMRAGGNRADDPRRGELDTMSVLQSRLLPQWVWRDDRRIDVSAFGAPEGWADVLLPRVRWIGAGTDGAQVEVTLEPSDQRRSLLVDSHGEPVRIGDHLDALVEGFEAAWQQVADLGSAAFDPGGVFAKLSDAPLRVVVRNTAEYTQLLHEAIEPRLHTDGLLRSLHFERLARSATTASGEGLTGALLNAERDQLEAGDVPYFTTTANADELLDPKGRVLATFALSALERARVRTAAMTPAELTRQRKVVANAASTNAVSTNRL